MPYTRIHLEFHQLAKVEQKKESRGSHPRSGGSSSTARRNWPTRGGGGKGSGGGEPEIEAAARGAGFSGRGRSAFQSSNSPDASGGNRSKSFGLGRLISTRGPSRSPVNHATYDTGLSVGRPAGP